MEYEQLAICLLHPLYFLLIFTETVSDKLNREQEFCFIFREVKVLFVKFIPLFNCQFLERHLSNFRGNWRIRAT